MHIPHDWDADGMRTPSTRKLRNVGKVLRYRVIELAVLLFVLMSFTFFTFQEGKFDALISCPFC